MPKNRNNIVKVIGAELCLSRAELAEKIGVSRVTIWRWESGKSEPPASKYLDILELVKTKK